MSKLWNDFMNSPYAREVLTALAKEKESRRVKEGQAAYSVNMDRNKLYDVGWHEDYLNPSTETMGVSGGGGSLVGSGDSKALYTTKPAPVQGGQEQYADGVVEGKEDIAAAMLEVAKKEPSGAPFGTQDNMPEKWEGIQAAGASVKPFTKQSQTTDPSAGAAISKSYQGATGMGDVGKMVDKAKEALGLEMGESDDEEGLSLEELLAKLDHEGEEGHGHHEHEADMMAGCSSMQMEPKGPMAMGSSQARKTVAFLEELVKMADTFDEAKDYESAAEIDQVLKAEVAALKAKITK